MIKAIVEPRRGEVIGFADVPKNVHSIIFARQVFWDSAIRQRTPGNWDYMKVSASKRLLNKAMRLQQAWLHEPGYSYPDFYAFDEE